jgi:lipopolysaccharide/colanic/teichoic acid biosynthesis glycosyltransferase
MAKLAQIQPLMAKQIEATVPPQSSTVEGIPAQGILLDLHGAEGFSAASRTFYAIAKRTTDLALTILLLILLAPLLVITALAVKLDSRGPVLFSQERIGTRRVRREGTTRWRLEPFKVFKFRSMIVDADSGVHERHIATIANRPATSGPSETTQIKLERDPRITRVGRYLRLTSIDELPQLINVLRGEMSLVGPRPVPTYEFARYRPEHMRRFTVLPGISGLWQIRGRCALPFWEMVACDIEYAEKQSFWTDLKIMVQTIPAVVSTRGAG